MPTALGSTVQATGDLLFASAAHDAQQIAGFGIHHAHGGLSQQAGGGGPVAFVGVDLFQNALDLGIHAGNDLQTAGIQLDRSGSFVVAVGCHQIGNDVLDNSIHVIGVHLGAEILIVIACEHQGCIVGFVKLFLRNESLRQHFAKHQIAAL